MHVVVNDRKRYLVFVLLPMSFPYNNGDFGRIPGIDRLLEKEDTSTHLQTLGMWLQFKIPVNDK